MQNCLAFLFALVLFQLSVFGRTVSRVPVGKSPDFVAVNSVTNRIYVSNSGDGTVSVVDGATNTVIATITVGGQPLGIAVNPGTNMVYVALFAGLDSKVDVIDGRSNTVTQTIDVPGATYLHVNPSTNLIYCSDSDNTVRVIHGTTNSVIATVAFTNVVEDLAIDVKRNLTYVAVGTVPPSVAVIDGSSLQVSNTFSISDAQFVPGLAVDSSMNLIYASDSLRMKVFVIDGASGTVASTIDLPAADPKYVTLGVRHQIWVADPGANQVFIINGNTQSLVGTQFIKGGPWGLAVNLRTGSVYIPSSLLKLLNVISF